MAKQTKPESLLLRWSDHIPASDVQDPLGLGLRGSARLASLLLFCITSVTRRARYFSFIPWCISDYQKQGKGIPHALDWRGAVRIRERALTYGCVAHHGGKPCSGGALVGSDAAIKWLAKPKPSVNLKKVPFAKSPAINVYLNSLVNLGVFVSEEERMEIEEELEDSDFDLENVELSELGQELANSYGSVVGRLGAVRALSKLDPTCSLSSLKEFGKRGGLCELVDASSPDRNLLRNIFFARKGFIDKSHYRRNRSLLLILDLCRQLGPMDFPLDADSFGSAVYYGHLFDEENGVVELSIPQPLSDIATRWRMFYFHHFMSVALEGMFSWVTTQLNVRGITGATINELVDNLNSPHLSRSLSEHFGQSISADFGATSPSHFFEQFGVTPSPLHEEASVSLDQAITANSPIAEIKLEDTIRDRIFLQSPTGLAVPAILFALTLGRYKRWESSEYGNWLVSDAVVKDHYLDLLPSTVSFGLSRHLENWWNTTWTKLIEFVLSRFVVQQHQSMSYEKTAIGDRCLLQVDGERVISDSLYEKIGLGNPRLGSALQVLVDLALLEKSDEGVPIATKDGLSLLSVELERKGEA